MAKMAIGDIGSELYAQWSIWIPRWVVGKETGRRYLHVFMSCQTVIPFVYLRQDKGNRTSWRGSLSATILPLLPGACCARQAHSYA